MELGFYLPGSGDGATRRGIAEIARAAEGAGFTSVWVADHVVAPVSVQSAYPFSPDGSYHNTPMTPYLEPLTTLAFAAGLLESARLVLSVLVVGYRHPLATAKIAATVDVLSEGRLTLGVGVGWMREEFEALGHDYFRQRGANADEQLEIMRKAWQGQPFAHRGRFYSFDEVVVAPAPVQQPLPIWVAGHTEAAFRRAVRFGQAINCNADPPAELAAIGARLKEISAEQNRADPPQLTMRCHLRVADRVEPFRPGHIIGPVGYLIDQLHEYAEAGVTVVGIDNRIDGIESMRENLRRLEPVLNHFHGGAKG